MLGFFPFPNQCYDIIIALNPVFFLFELVSQLSNIAHGPLVWVKLLFIVNYCTKSPSRYFSCPLGYVYVFGITIISFVKLLTFLLFY